MKIAPNNNREPMAFLNNFLNWSEDFEIYEIIETSRRKKNDECKTSNSSRVSKDMGRLCRHFVSCETSADICYSGSVISST